MNSRNIILFLGAGFSKDAGLPIMSEFGDESNDHLKRLRDPNNKRDSTPYLMKAGDIYFKFQEYCARARRFVNLNANNMEELFCIAEVLNEAKIIDFNIDGEYIRTEELCDQIKIWLWKIYQQCPPLNPKKNIEREKIEAYDSFFDFLKKSRLSNKLTIITTNYDLVFEYFAWKRGIPCVYPLKKDEVEPLRVFDSAKSEYYISFEPEEEGPIICKLHGSINFFNLKQQDNDNTFGISFEIAKKEDHPTVPNTPRPAIFMLDAIWKIRQKIAKGNGEIDLAIVPPTYAKLRKYSWLRDIWNSSFRAIENANCIIFIGYSIPESDGFVRAMINGALAVRNAKTDLQVIVVDPDKENVVVNRYKKIFPHLNSSPKCFVKMGFCEAWKQGELIRLFSTIAT